MYVPPSLSVHVLAFGQTQIPKTKYVFMGDFVDRGYYSAEVVQLFFALKLKYPGHIVLIRGNHEGRQVIDVYICDGI